MDGQVMWGREEGDRDRFALADNYVENRNVFDGIYESEMTPTDARGVRLDTEIIETDRLYFAHFKTTKQQFLRIGEKVEAVQEVLSKSYNSLKATEALVRNCINQYE